VNSKRISILMAATLLFWQGIGVRAAQADDNTLAVQAYATDTVAGYPSALRTSLIDPNQDVRFVVEKPDGSVAQIPAQADLDGIAKTDFYGSQTKQAGKYKVAVVYPGSSASSPQATFTVFPDQVSTTQSTLKSTQAMVSAGTEATYLVVTLYDQYRNPIPNHTVKLISSRSEDRILVLQDGNTDQNGRANFKITSPDPGVSVFTAFDTTVNQILDSREQVVFFQPAPVAASSSLGNLLQADIGEGSTEPLPGPVDHFEITDLPAQAKAGQQLSLTVTAKDQNGNDAKGYTGTIVFSTPDDENAQLPNGGEYTFKDTDQGKFTFNLALAFTQLGKQTVQVLDKKNYKIMGENTVQVVSQEGAAPGPASTTLFIKSPTDGSQLGSATIDLVGQGKENINLKVFMDDAKIGDSQTDSTGFFKYEATNVSSAQHTFYVMSDSGEVSAPVSITVDTTPPVINSFSIDPQGTVLPGEQLNVTITSEPKLDSAKIRLQGAETDLKESTTDPGTYTATVAAPDLEGSYGVDATLVDALGNKADILNKATVIVKKPAPVAPPTVVGLEGTPGDGSIQLKWTPAQPTDKPIQKYRIAYGTSLTQLDKTVDTNDSTAAWELRDLTNGTQYFVNVKAVDSQGLESADPSVTIAATPVAPAPVAQPTPAPTTPSIQAIPSDGAVTLTWTEFPSVQAYYYKILIGFGPGQVSDSIVTPDNRTSAIITDLINGLAYTFSVEALDLNGKVLSPLSDEAQATPTGSGLRPAAPSALPQDFGGVTGQLQPPSATVATAPTGQNIYASQLGQAPSSAQTGPEALWVVVASVVFAFYLTHHKRKILNSK
jgi:Fibronectin type III domain/Bacterial Ig-like domain (group 1)